VGREDQNNKATVIGAIRDDMQKYGGDPAVQTLHDTIVKLRQERDSIEQQKNSTNTELVDARKTILSLQSQYQGTVDQHQKAALEANAALQAQIAEKDEIARKKDEMIDDLNRQKSTALLDLEKLKQSTDATISQLDGEKSQLLRINDDLRRKLIESTQQSFEVADGEIRQVDHSQGLVWVNLGAADNLQVRTTFSVYTKGHHGVGRDVKDIKGTIEVTKITGPHIAEARVTNSDLYRPISPGDPIFTPLWSPNQVESFSFVGFVDLDGDGKSDRDRLHEIVAAAGAKIDNEVDDQGNVHGDGIDVNTRYLIIGKIPDPTQYAAEEREAAKRIGAAADKLSEAARRQGVQELSLPMFLSYIGYHTSQRLYVKGGKTPWTLKSGAHSASTDETVTDRAASGNVSGVYTTRGRVIQPTTGPAGSTSQGPYSRPGTSNSNTR
jgi:hypothetical protein